MRLLKVKKNTSECSIEKYKEIKNKVLIPIYNEIKEITFDEIKFTWIPRKENVHADQLANKILDSKK